MEGAGPGRQVEKVVSGDDLNQDLYCLECGYNLRGLSGDPRRCPECGHDNPMSELTIPARAIRRQCARMESAAARCVGAFWFFGIVLTLFATQHLEDKAGLVIVALGAAIIVWVQGATSFCGLCSGRPEWAKGLALYHFYSTMAGALVATVLLGSGTLVGHLLDGCSGTIAVVVATGVCVWLGANWIRRRIRATLAPLQRATAAHMASQQSGRREKPLT